MSSRSDSYVYRWRNNVNGHMYIGKGRKRRFWVHVYDSRKDVPGSLIAKAIKKYGVSNFELTLLEEGLTPEEAALRERYYIAKWNTFHDSNHYNVTEGGEGALHAEITKRKIGDKNRGELNGFYGRRHTDETRQVMSQKRRGRKTSKVTKARMSVSCHNKKRFTPEVEQAIRDMAEAGTQVSEIAKRFNVSRTPIYRVLNR